jgi:diguanylate cyclase (GGDEF)-like protein
MRRISPAEDASNADHGPIPQLQDATFLNAVLPFALGLAKRHGESLALLCVAVDRLGGIRELMGKESADRAVDAVGRQVAAMIRSSDIVARIDDDRIIAVLPRAPLGHARRVAERICRTVEPASSRSAGLPGLTVSIGIAEYPTCASTLYALLDAADHALAEAQRTGRNRVVSAPPGTASTPGEGARAYQSMTEPSSLS